MKLKIITTLIFLLLYGVFYYTNTQTKNERINLILNDQIKILKVNYNVTMSYFFQDAKSIRNNIENNQKIINIFSKAQNATQNERKILRDKMYKLLTPMYKRIHSRGVLQFHFVLPSNITFLRMHKPSKFEDDLSDIRYSFRHANKTKQTVEGFEQGRTIHSFRYVFPFYNKKGKHLGAIGIALSSYALQDKLLNVNKLHSHFLVSKNVFNVKAWKTKKLIQEYIQSIEHENYKYAVNEHADKKRLLETEKNIIKPLKEEINKGILSKKAFSLHTIDSKTAKIITFLPIKNTENNHNDAYIVSYTNNHTIFNISKDYYKLNIIIFIGLFLVFYFIYKNLNYKDELEKEVKKQTKDLQKVSNDLIDLNENLEQKIIIEIEKNTKIQNQLFKSEKLSSMGEMIGNIAHQWRQPLSVISTGVTGMKIQKEFDLLTDEQFNETCDAINNNAQYLSKTIDDFRNFIKGDTTKKIFKLVDDINSFLQLVESSIKSNNIKIVLDLDKDIKIDGYENELTQCLINIFNNAKDALENKPEVDRLIFITTKTINDKAIIMIKDNAGGIPDDIINKIFEPYFTTKHQYQGTGLGLHMTYNLIVDGMSGTVEADNVNFQYEGNEYTGASFIISLPLI